MDEVEAPSVLVKLALSSDSSKTFWLVSHVNLPILPSPGWHESVPDIFLPIEVLIPCNHISSPIELSGCGIFPSP